jgi:hypothetical protein
MNLSPNFALCAFAAMGVAWQASIANAAVVIPVTNWGMHNGSGSVNAPISAPNSPTITPGDNNVVMGAFAPITLLKTGDSIKVSAKLTTANRTANTGVNALNTQLRIGLFDGPGSGTTPTLNDLPNTGYIIEYSNAAGGGLIRRQDNNTTQTNPFTSPTNVGNGVQDSGADSIQSANIGQVLFELMLTRNGNLINLSGLISGADPVSGNPYSSTFTANNLALAPNGFVFDRMGFFFGGNVDAPNATLGEVTITAVIPEPGSFIVFSLIAAAGGAGWWRKRHLEQ